MLLLRVLLLVALIACRGSNAAMVDGPPSDTVQPGDGATSDTPGSNEDGAPVRKACTSTFGSALTSGFGRMDGYLIAIVPPGPSTAPCNADQGHLHLQVMVDGAIYDVAVNVGTDDATNDVHTTTLDTVQLGLPWSEGWHTDVTNDYTALGIHSAALPLHSRAENVAALTAELATVNHVSVFGTGYSPTPSGAHLIHRNNGRDGMLVTHPLAAAPHARLFSFTTPTF